MAPGWVVAGDRCHGPPVKALRSGLACDHHRRRRHRCWSAKLRRNTRSSSPASRKRPWSPLVRRYWKIAAWRCGVQQVVLGCRHCARYRRPRVARTFEVAPSWSGALAQGLFRNPNISVIRLIMRLKRRRQRSGAIPLVVQTNRHRYRVGLPVLLQRRGTSQPVFGGVRGLCADMFPTLPQRLRMPRA